MDTYYRELGNLARQQYDHAYATGYRNGDTHGVGTPFHADFEHLITEQSLSFGRPIDVLDVGCGTGRYFHCLRNVKSLTGIDVSPDMLICAKHPVCQEKLEVKPRLLCIDLAEFTWPDASFDFIYSIGVLGEFMPFDHFICEKFARMLKPGGKFVFTVYDSSTSGKRSWKRRAAELSLCVLPSGLKDRLKARLRHLALSEEQLKRIVGSQFKSHTISKRSRKSGRIQMVSIATKGVL